MSIKADKKFVGRERELEQLRRVFESSRPDIAIIYGRRRIGKTELISQALEKRPALFFEGIEGEGKRKQIENFLFQLKNQTGIEYNGQAVKSWHEAFYLLLPWLQANPAIVVFDEFQWTANYRTEIVSELKMIWDQYWSKVSGVKMVICGSIASFIKDRVVKSNALYGRAGTIIHLNPLTLRESQEMLRNSGKQKS